MTRPILWAAGTLVTVAVWGSMAGTRIARRVDVAPQARSAPVAESRAPAGGGILVLQSDLRGHYIIHPEIEGRRTTMLVDTGASTVALTVSDAAAAGYRPSRRDFTMGVSTANGRVAAAPIRIREIRAGNIVIRDVEAVVLPDASLGTSLLGMSFLRRLGGFEVSAGRLTLRG